MNLWCVFFFSDVETKSSNSIWIKSSAHVYLGFVYIEEYAEKFPKILSCCFYAASVPEALASTPLLWRLPNYPSTL